MLRGNPDSSILTLHIPSWREVLCLLRRAASLYYKVNFFHIRLSKAGRFMICVASIGLGRR